MNTMTKKELIKTTKPRYLKADKEDKSKILAEFCSNTGSNRKYAIAIVGAGYEYDRVKIYGRKNDNAYLEQKNNTPIRHWLGYGRYDTFEQLRLINDLYREELRLFNNFFRPVMKIESKEKINNSVCRKRYDQANTPYQRLMDSNQISSTKKTGLRELYLSLNPVELKQAIIEKLNKIRSSKPAFMKNLSTNKVRNYMSQPVGTMVRFLNK